MVSRPPTGIHPPQRRRHQAMQVIPYQGNQDSLPGLCLTVSARKLIMASLAPSTIRAFQSDIRMFLRRGGTLPSTDTEIANYLTRCFEDGYKPNTLKRQLCSLRRWHLVMNCPTLGNEQMIKGVMRGCARLNEVPVKRAPALMRDDLHQLLNSLNLSELRDLRDAAMFCLTFYGAFRYSEVLNLRVEHLTWDTRGVLVRLSRSKTNQEGRHEVKAIHHADTSLPYCPVNLLYRWLEAAHIQRGAVFRSVSLGGRPGGSKLSRTAFQNALIRGLERSNLASRGFSTHSMRAGLITEAHLRGKSLEQIQRVTGHRHLSTLTEYIRVADPFENSANDF